MIAHLLPSIVASTIASNKMQGRQAALNPLRVGSVKGFELVFKTAARQFIAGILRHATISFDQRRNISRVSATKFVHQYIYEITLVRCNTSFFRNVTNQSSL